MLYFHNSSEEIQKLATYAAKKFQLLGAKPSESLIRGSAPGPRWGTAPDSQHILSMPAISPEPRVC